MSFDPGRPEPRPLPGAEGRPSPTGPAIDGYLLALRGRLTGPRRLKNGLLDEARDGLQDAARAYRMTGSSDEEAQRRAVADFGGLDVISSEFQEELDIVQGRATALHASIGLPLLLAVWQFVHMARPWPAIEPGWAEVISVLGYGAGLVNLIAIAGVWYVRLIAGNRPRPFRRPAGGRRLLGAFVLTALGAYAAAVTLIASATALVSWRLLLAPAVAGAIVVSLVLCALLAGSARRCLSGPR